MILDNAQHKTIPPFEKYLSDSFRDFIESRFYHRITEKARLEHLKFDDTFIKSPIKHIGLYSDHGTVHVRDVAAQTLQVIERVNGVLIPRREGEELEFMRAYGLHLAYLHDIGMVNFSEYGRFMHPEYAARYVFRPEFGGVFQQLWEDNSGGLPAYLQKQLAGCEDLGAPKRLLRELLALSVTHSKSKVPVSVLNSPGQLRSFMQEVLSQPLENLYYQQKLERLRRKMEKEPEGKWEKKIVKLEKKRDRFRASGPKEDSSMLSFYEDFEREAFRWVIDERPKLRRLLLNVLDTLRCLRAADALRQRGTTLRTSAGYEVFVDQKSANAIYALRSENDDELYMLEGKKPLNAGEANLASSEMDAEGNLRVSPHRGWFRNRKVVRKAAFNLAVVIDDIQADTIRSFQRDDALYVGVFPLPKRSFDDVSIIVEGVDDNPDFAELVRRELCVLNPGLEAKLQTSASLQGADLAEVNRYLAAADFRTWFPEKPQVKELLDRLLATCIYPRELEEKKAFREVRVIRLSTGEQLIREGSPSGFVYLPMARGLRVYPLGGYESKLAPPWIPIGNTGVIRGSVRNASVVAEAPVNLLVIPKQVYLQHWYAPYDARTLSKIWKQHVAK